MYIFKPLKQNDSETYCSFTGIKNQIDEIKPGNNTEKNDAYIHQIWVDKHIGK
jgi:hypothetical protein